jgi:hypothetical protein
VLKEQLMRNWKILQSELQLTSVQYTYVRETRKFNFECHEEEDIRIFSRAPHEKNENQSENNRVSI